MTVSVESCSSDTFDILLDKFLRSNYTEETLVPLLKSLRLLDVADIEPYKMELILGASWERLSATVVSELIDVLLDWALSRVQAASLFLACLFRQFRLPGAIVAHEAAQRCLRMVLARFPLLARRLRVTASGAFPYRKRPQGELCAYLTNLLAVIRSAASTDAELRSELYGLAIAKVLSIDVDTPQQEVETAREEETFAMETSDSMADRLDATMQVMLDHVRTTCLPSPGELDLDAAKQLLADWAAPFERTVLLSTAASHVPFLWLYLLSLHPELAQNWLDRLWSQFLEPSSGPVTRACIAGYLASLLARALFIHVRTVHEVLAQWASWLQAYADSAGPSAQHEPFHALAQALFYVIAFRHADLADRKGLRRLQQLNLERIVKCPLNPLNFCSEHLLSNFANVTRHHQLAYCYTVIERNERRRRDESQQAVARFYPFDPCLLPRTRAYVADLCREYRMVQERAHPEPMETDLIEELVERELNGAMAYSVSPGFRHS